MCLIWHFLQYELWKNSPFHLAGPNIRSKVREKGRRFLRNHFLKARNIFNTSALHRDWGLDTIHIVCFGAKRVLVYEENIFLWKSVVWRLWLWWRPRTVQHWIDQDEESSLQGERKSLLSNLRRDEAGDLNWRTIWEILFLCFLSQEEEDTLLNSIFLQRSLSISSLHPNSSISVFHVPTILESQC